MSIDLAPAGTASLAAGDGHLELCFGGVQFGFCGAPHLLDYVARGAQFPQATGGLESASQHSRVFARVKCRLVQADVPRTLGATSNADARAVAYEWKSGIGHATAWGTSVRITTEPGQYGAEASLAPSHRAAQNLLNLLAYSLVHRAAGAVLHAASVELPEGVIAFVGPSGAGKSTACQHTQGARFFSADRLAVVPAALSEAKRSTWSAHALPGGTPLVGALPASDSAGRPLLAVLRVRQAPTGCSFERCPTSRAVAVLRESTFQVNRSLEPEVSLLGRLERLALSVPVGNLHFGLGTPLGSLLRRWLHDGTLYDAKLVSEPG